MADQIVNATKLDTKKLNKNIPTNFVTIQKKSSKADLIIVILLVLLAIVIGLIVYFTMNPVS